MNKYLIMILLAAFNTVNAESFTTESKDYSFYTTDVTVPFNGNLNTSMESAYLIAEYEALRNSDKFYFSSTLVLNRKEHSTTSFVDESKLFSSRVVSSQPSLDKKTITYRFEFAFDKRVKKAQLAANKQFLNDRYSIMGLAEARDMEIAAYNAITDYYERNSVIKSPTVISTGTKTFFDVSFLYYYSARREFESIVKQYLEPFLEGSEKDALSKRKIKPEYEKMFNKRVRLRSAIGNRTASATLFRKVKKGDSYYFLTGDRNERLKAKLVFVEDVTKNKKDLNNLARFNEPKFQSIRGLSETDLVKEVEHWVEY